MARFFVPLDVNYQFDDKIIAAGPIGECLYTRSLALVKRTGSEGRIHRTQLTGLALGLPGRPQRHADTLVEVGLWSTTCDGWVITAWLKHNLSNGELAEQKAKIKAKSIKGNHQRHHVAQGVTDPDCELCNPPQQPPHGEPPASPQGTKPLPTEEEDEPKTNRRRTEDEEENEAAASPHGSNREPQDDPAAAAVEILIEHRLATQHIDNPGPYANKVRRDTWREHGDHLRRGAPAGTADPARWLATHVLGVPGLNGTTTEYWTPPDNIREQTRGTIRDYVKQAKEGDR